jgi:cold shock protein
MEQESTMTSTGEHLVGRVKWFNTKAGYGFITVTDGPFSGNDIFVHHSAINVVSQQYKYLVQGEYVEFDLGKVADSKHEWNALHVVGIRNGKLMCETRHETKLAKNEYRSTKQSDSKPPSNPVSLAFPKQKQVKPHIRDTDSSWNLVVKKNRSSSAPTTNSNPATSKPATSKQATSKPSNR